MRRNGRKIAISNNHMVLNRFADAVPVEGGPCEVLKEALNFLDKGFVLSFHALSGSIRLYCNPYRSLVVEPANGDSVDGSGIKVILDAIDRVDDAVRTRPVPTGFRQDYAVIDLDLLESQYDGPDERKRA